MELKYGEKFLLALYLEYFDLEYDFNDDRIINVGNGFLRRHVEMQNICYLMQNHDIYIGNEYGFMWNYTGPYSNKLRLDQSKLDVKQVEIASFYKEYNDKRSRWGSTYGHQLQDLLKEYCPSDKANKIAFSSFVLEDIMRFENGSIILAGMLYIYKTLLPGANKNRIFEELEKRLSTYGIYTDRELEELAWRSAQIIGLIDIERKHSVEGQGRLRRIVRK